MDLQKEAAFLEYLQILDKSSKKFKEAIAKLKALPNEELDQALAETLAEFFIPVTQRRKATLMRYLLNGKILSKHNIFIDLLASPERPGTIKYDCPSVILQITGNIRTKNEWMKIWEDMTAKEKAFMKTDPNLQSMSGLKDHKVRRPYENIDLLLEIYVLAKNKWSLKRIYLEMPKLKQKLGIKKSTDHMEEDIRRMIKQIEAILLKL